jgi:hypothetical protein
MRIGFICCDALYLLEAKKVFNMASAIVIAHSLTVLDQLIPVLRWTALFTGLTALLFVFRPLLAGLAKAAWLMVRPRRQRRLAPRGQALHAAE